MVFTDEQFARLYPTLGQPATSPSRLALVTLLPFMENLTDREAADAVRSRIDWKYLLALELTDVGFHYSVLRADDQIKSAFHRQPRGTVRKQLRCLIYFPFLSEFRQRLLEHGEEETNHQSMFWKEGKSSWGRPNIHFLFSRPLCFQCSSHEKCFRTQNPGIRASGRTEIRSGSAHCMDIPVVAGQRGC